MSRRFCRKRPVDIVVVAGRLFDSFLASAYSRLIDGARRWDWAGKRFALTDIAGSAFLWDRMRVT
jgi:hypothetical protein